MNEYDKPCERQFTGVWIPREILEDANLKATDKILYAEIASFGENGCWKKSEELMAMVGVKADAFQASCKRLVEGGYITQNRRFGRIIRRITLGFSRTEEIHRRENPVDEHRENPINESREKPGVHIDNTIENTKDNTILAIANRQASEVQVKETNKPVEYGNRDINELFTYWSETLGFEITSRKQANRRACYNLIKKAGVDGVKKLINTVAVAYSEQYAPKIRDFEDLQARLNALLAWGKTKMVKNTQNQENVF